MVKNSKHIAKAQSGLDYHIAGNMGVVGAVFCLLSPDRPRKIAPTQKFLLVFLKKIFLFHVLRFSFSISSIFPFKNAENVL